MEMQDKIDNVEYRFLALANLIAAIAVVILHTNVCFWEFSSTEQYWSSANVIECVFFFAVPVFFMISGANNLDYTDKYSTNIFFKKRIVKTCVPYLIWSAFGAIFLIVVEHRDYSVDRFVRGLLDFNVIEIYWFFRPLFCSYLCMPLFSAVERRYKNKVYCFLIIVAVVFNNLLPFICNVFNLDYPIPFTIPVASGYLVFVLLGYVLTRNNLCFYCRVVVYFLALSGLMMHMIGTHKLSIAQGQIVTTFKGYCNIPSLLYSIGVFVFIKQVAKYITMRNVWKIVFMLGKYTFPLYLMQWFAFRIVDLTNINKYSLWYRLGGVIVIFPLVILITIILRRIPIIKHIVP